MKKRMKGITNWLLFAAVASLMLTTACGSGKTVENAPPQQPQSPGDSKTPTIAETLAKLEASGELPVLDRTESVKGTDANGDGIRDDIENYINSQADTAPQKSSLRQLHRAFSHAMTANASENLTEIESTGREIANAVQCMSRKYAPDVFNAKMKEIRKYTVNTRSRFDAYIAFNEKSNGFILRLPEGDSCEDK